MTLSEKFDSFKNEANAKLEDAKTFCREHSIEIAEGAVIVALSCTCGVLLHSSNNKDKVIAALKLDNLIAHRRIDEMVDLCNHKDEIMCKTMSDGLRHGSPVAAQQMVARKQMLS